MQGGSAVSRAPSQVPRTPSADHLRRGERRKGGAGRRRGGRESERGRELEGARWRQREAEAKIKQKTTKKNKKTDEGHKVSKGGVQDPMQVDWGGTEEKPNCPFVTQEPFSGNRMLTAGCPRPLGAALWSVRVFFMCVCAHVWPRC